MARALVNLKSFESLGAIVAERNSFGGRRAIGFCTLLIPVLMLEPVLLSGLLTNICLRLDSCLMPVSVPVVSSSRVGVKTILLLISLCDGDSFSLNV